MENFKENETFGVRKLENIEDDHDVRNLIYQRILSDVNISDLTLQSEVLRLYGERYPDMSLNDWRHVIEAYTPMVRDASKSEAKEISMQQLGMAAEPDE